ncbi:MAG TPA: hypothetical protein VJL33_02525 [Candidatus Bathyarchaeia archaeon]|nr:hypothetical protein [Candidatus Bathyarchaeia archaeon]
MIQLRGEIQEGFYNDTVIVKVNGAEVFNKGPLTTSLLGKGPTAFFCVDVKKGLVKVEVFVPTRNLQDTKNFLIRKNKNLGISIDTATDFPSGIRFILSDKPFLYG